jgi:hypothetical protein
MWKQLATSPSGRLPNDNGAHFALFLTVHTITIHERLDIE